MDPKVEFNKVMKDLEKSAKEFAQMGLQMSAKLLETTAATLKSLEHECKKNAEKLNTKPAETTPAQGDMPPVEQK